MADLLPMAIPALLLVNAGTVLRFWQDKQRADLLGLALIGGSPGALLARQLFRHKTRKASLSMQLFVIVAVQIGAVIGFALS